MIAPGFKRLVIGPDRNLRMLWRAVIFFALAYWVLPVALDPAFGFVAERLHLAAGLTAANVAINEFENFIVALICTAIFARYEGRRVDSYGLPVAGAFGAHTGEGALAGIVMAGAVAAAMYLMGGMHIHGLATAGSALALSRREPVRRRGGGVLVPLLFPAGAVEEPRLLAGVDRHRAHLRG
jgi:hypothetical protein